MAIATGAFCYIKSKKTVRPNPQAISIVMNRVAALVLGGGEGSRLFPLTATRCKPAICFGGKYRMIDVPISNCFNAGCFKIFVITQFLSASLHKHILSTYRLDSFKSGFIELLAAEQKPQKKEWYAGTADAVRQNIEYFVETPVDYFLILSGDQLYHMNYQNMVRLAMETDADVVVAALPVNGEDARRMGILKVGEDNLITDFHEKPKEKTVLERFALPHSLNEELGIDSSSNRNYLGSMGIYLFKRQVLLETLASDHYEDFGKHLIPSKVQQGKVVAYIHNGYWEDIGTIGSFYKANIALTKPYPEFNFHDENHPIYSYHSNLPAPKLFNTHVDHSIICEGSIIEADEITNSILGPRSVIETGTVIRDSYVMGNDFYTRPVNTPNLPENIVIEEDSYIQNCIIDKNVHIGKGVELYNKQKLTSYNGENIFIRDGIIVVTRGASIPDGFIL